MVARLVVDTNVVVSALMKADSTPRHMLRVCLERRCQPLMGNALLAEHEDLLGRSALFEGCLLTTAERAAFLDDFLSVCEWISVYYLWRPNLRDEADNHLLELAVAGGAQSIVTGNVGDFRQATLLFPTIAIVTPRQFLDNLESPTWEH